MTKFVKRLVWYPAVLIAAWTFATINRIQNAVDPDNPIFGLFLLHTSLVAFQGIFNALVYGSTDAVKSAAAQELIVERCLKATGAGRGGGGDGAGFSGRQGDSRLDPEEDEEEVVAGVGMISIGHGNSDDSLGGFDDVEMDAQSESAVFDAEGSRVSES